MIIRRGVQVVALVLRYDVFFAPIIFRAQWMLVVILVNFLHASSLRYRTTKVNQLLLQVDIFLSSTTVTVNCMSTV